MRIFIGSDHRGVEVRDHIAGPLRAQGHDVHTVAVGSNSSCDYPDVAYPVALAVAGGEADRGILICGTGIGMSIAANKVAGVRAALVHDEVGADMSRRHNNAKVLCLSADGLNEKQMVKVIRIFLDTPFDGGRHERRVNKVMDIEAGKEPGA